MMPGDVYPYHIRGSRYSFSSGRVFYKYSNGAKLYVPEDQSTELYNKLSEVRQGPGGRLKINEEGEVTIYRPNDDHQWVPYYVGKLTKELQFNGIDNNPRHLEPGMLWTGFLSNHGAKFHIERSGRIFFRETTPSVTRRDRQDYYVLDAYVSLIRNLAKYKGAPGSFHINEYGHVWAPVSTEFARYAYGLDKLSQQDLSTEQKRTITSYVRTTSEDGMDNGWLPIYIGHFPRQLKINREPVPHIIEGTAYDEDEGFYPEWAADE